MALHLSMPGSENKAIASMLRESLDEMIIVSRWCVDNHKSDGGIFGYPAAVLLFSIADSIGSYLLGGTIRNHFNVYNHEVFGFNLSKEQLDKIYKYFRSLLTHYLVMASGCALIPGHPDGPVFQNIIISEVKNLGINIPALQKKTDKAVSEFVKLDVEKMVKNSKSYSNMLGE